MIYYSDKGEKDVSQRVHEDNQLEQEYVDSIFEHYREIKLDYPFPIWR